MSLEINSSTSFVGKHIQLKVIFGYDRVVSDNVEGEKEVGTSQKRLSVGVTKLEETNAVVEGLQVELTAQPVLKEKAEAAAKMIVVERDRKKRT